MANNPFGARQTLSTPSQTYSFYRLEALEKAGVTRISSLPFSIRLLLESVLRQSDDRLITNEHVVALAGWKPSAAQGTEVPFLPGRVVMQDFTGVPAIVDLAAMRSALARLGGDPARINPLLPVDLVIDHSVQVDFFASREAMHRNAALEFDRNRERYEFLRWAQEAFDNLRVVPPATGIVHQVNLEYLATLVLTRQVGDRFELFPDTLVGTDSHTTMINGLGVLGWGVGGIEAEAAILGQPLVIISPDVVGFRLFGELPEGATATDLVLTITQVLRQFGVVGKFVEFFGPGLSSMSLPDRATIANMAPEYGATVGYFPVDDETLRYLQSSGRDPHLVDLVERYFKEQALFRTAQTPDPSFTDLLELDLSTVETSLAGPKRPQDRVPLSGMKESFRHSLSAPTEQGGFGLPTEALGRSVAIHIDETTTSIRHGSVVIAAITSCTNTSNPSVMIAAGLLAKKAVELGLRVKPHVKTSLAPGSRVVTDYLREAGLMEPLERLGFHIVGYGCTTCIGNSGPLPQRILEAVKSEDLVVAAVLSGNRNFEGRIQPFVRAAYLASPPLVVAYALAGTTDLDLHNEPLGRSPSGEPVFLRDLWPRSQDIQAAIDRSIRPDMFKKRYADAFTGNPTWNAIQVPAGDLYTWTADSTYIQEPPFFTDLTPQPQPIRDLYGARALVLLGDSVTTDHISPAGAIPAESPAGRYLLERGIAPKDFNSFGSRRGNDRVMTRGTFGNIRLRNLLIPGTEGGETIHLPDGKRMSIFEAAQIYRQEGVPLIVLAGKEYGAGSSRDWAAKGSSLLGITAVIAESFERIHRSNLIGMGVLPLQFKQGQGVNEIGLNGHEVFDIIGLSDDLAPGSKVILRAHRQDGSTLEVETLLRIDIPLEVEYYRNGGILQTVLRQILGNTV